uniref:Caspase family p20 domain-containing protein n=1 Tax=Glossina palpalis gambiensis TaxID=67801 RepID=A0A1B0BSF7_9MUSC
MALKCGKMFIHHHLYKPLRFVPQLVVKRSTTSDYCNQMSVLTQFSESSPESFEEDNRQAQLKRMIALEMNPITGLASKWDYEVEDWKSRKYCASDTHIRELLKDDWFSVKWEDSPYNTMMNWLKYNPQKKLLKKLDFEVTYHKDCKLRELLECIEKAATQDHSDNDCIAIAKLSHDEQGYLYAKDIMYKIDTIWHYFTAISCPTLAGKPKLFFTQACRGDRLDPFRY